MTGLFEDWFVVVVRLGRDSVFGEFFVEYFADFVFDIEDTVA